jgi:hypothetical protein
MAIMRDSAALSDVAKRSITHRLTNDLKSFHWEIGGAKYPEYPIECDVEGRNVGEAFAEIEKMFGKLGDRLNSSVINRNNLAPRISEDDSHAPNQNSKFMCGVELETYGSNNVEAGIDTANGSPSMNIVLNLNSADTHSVKGTRVDSFAAFDALYQINPDLTLSVAF